MDELAEAMGHICFKSAPINFTIATNHASVFALLSVLPISFIKASICPNLNTSTFSSVSAFDPFAEVAGALLAAAGVLGLRDSVAEMSNHSLLKIRVEIHFCFLKIVYELVGV